MAGTRRIELDFPLAWSTDPAKYLGVWLHRDPEVVVSENYDRALVQITERAERWAKLPLSLADRIAVVKMTILPKLLYLFINVPICLNLPLFNSLQSALLFFVWGGKKPRCSWEVLVLPFECGGFEALIISMCTGPVCTLLVLPTAFPAACRY